jgi:hypothetical protein
LTFSDSWDQAAAMPRGAFMTFRFIRQQSPLATLVGRATARLRQLPLREAAAARAERLSPAHESLRAETGWDENDAFRQLLNRVWEHISTDEAPEPDLAGRSLALTPEGDVEMRARARVHAIIAS